MGWKDSSETFRAIVTLFKRISDECRMAKVWPYNYCTYAFNAATAFCAFM
jgi:hypothetical protein